MECDAEHYESIGRMIVKFQYLEHCIEWYIWHLLRVPKRQADIVLCEASFSRKLSMLQSLGMDTFASPPHDYVHKDDHLRELERIMKEAFLCEARRNQFIHSYWLEGVRPTDGKVIRIKMTAKSGRGLRTQGESLSAREILEVASTMERLAQDTLRACQWAMIQYDLDYCPGMTFGSSDRDDSFTS